MRKKDITVQIISRYCLRYDYSNTIVKDTITVKKTEVKPKYWGRDLAQECYLNKDLFPYLEELDGNNPVIYTEFYVLDNKGVKNGWAQGWTYDYQGFKPEWDCTYKNGKIHGKYTKYEHCVISKPRKSFYINDEIAGVKTLAQWLRQRAEIKSQAKNAQIKQK